MAAIVMTYSSRTVDKSFDFQAVQRMNTPSTDSVQFYKTFVKCVHAMNIEVEALNSLWQQLC